MAGSRARLVAGLGCLDGSSKGVENKRSRWNVNMITHWSIPES